MKTKQIGLIALLAIIISIALIACKEDDPHSHTWGTWIETTSATLTGDPLVEIDGVETRTCSTCGEKETRPVTFRSYFYGEWKMDSRINMWTISATEIVRTSSTWSYTLGNGLTITPIVNTGDNAVNYPYGFTFTGKLTGRTNEDIPSGINLGESYSDSVYLHTDRNSIVAGTSNNAIKFIKQTQ